MGDSPKSADAFNALFARHQRQVYRFIAVLLPDRDAAEEAFQQTCYELLSSREKYDPERDFLAWAHGVARNVVRSQLRAKRKSPLALSDALLDQLADVQARVSQSADAQLSALSDCLKKLPAEQRRLLDVCYLKGESIRSIAHRRKVAPVVLYKRLDRIRWKLLACIERGTLPEDRS